MDVIKCHVGLFLFSWDVAKSSKLRTMGSQQVINHIDGKISPNTITPNSLNERTKYLKTDDMKKALLEWSCWTNRIGTERAWRCNSGGRSWQQDFSGKVYSPLPLSGHAAVDTVVYAEGDEEARVFEEHMWSIIESQHLDSWHNRGHIGQI